MNKIPPITSMMKLKFIFLLFILFGIKHGFAFGQLYYSDKLFDKYGIVFYIIAERINDTLIIDSYYKQGLLIQMNYKKIIPLVVNNYGYIEISSIKEKTIGIRMNLNQYCNCSIGWVTFKLKKQNKPDQVYLIWNTYASQEIDREVYEKVTILLNLLRPNNYNTSYFSDKRLLWQEKQLPPDSFKIAYKLCNDSLIENTKNSIIEKTNLLQKLKLNTDLIDSAFVSGFYENYKNCYIDNRLFYLIFSTKPHLYPLKYKSIPHRDLFEAIGFCYSHFSDAEVAELYKKLLPYKSTDNRILTYKSLWSFERRVTSDCK